MKKIYILICTNDEHEIVSCKAYNTIDQAMTMLAAEYYTEYHRNLMNYQGLEKFVTANIDYDNNSASVTYSGSGRFWEIETVEIPE